MNWLALLKLIGPVILSSIPGVPPVIVPLVVHGIETAEAIKGATGAQKKAAVIDLVETGIAAVNVATGTQKVDPTAVGAAVSAGIDTTVQAINLVHQAQA